MSRSFLIFSLCVLLLSGLAAQEKDIPPLYKNPSAPIEDRVADLLSRLTLEEKIDRLGGVEGFYIRPNERLGIPKIKMSDGPLGVRNYGETTAFPAGIAMAAAWNPGLMSKVGEMVGREARSKGVHIMLSPGLNIHRAPMCGRNFEYFGEDPCLAGRMAVAYVQGVQSQGVVATVKHFAANNQEVGRHRVSSDMDERTLQEIYLPAFRAAVVEGKAGAVMSAYNLLNGVYCSSNAHLLNDILKGQWKFDGFVMSDWGAVHDGLASVNGGLNLEMPSGKFMNRETILPALQAGRVEQSAIDDKDNRVRYAEGIFLGYRHYDRNKIAPLFPFGYGLSYTTFAYSDLSLKPKRTSPGQQLKVSFKVKNTGKREGAEIAQLYIRDVESSEPRPIKELKGLAKVFLRPGQTKTVEIELGESDLSFYSAQKNRWLAEPGEFEVMVGSSSADLKLRTHFTLQ